MRRYLFSLIALLLITSCGGGRGTTERSTTVDDSNCSGQITGTVIDNLSSSSLFGRAFVTVEASFATAANITSYYPVAGAAPDSQGRFSICVPKTLPPSADLLLAMASTDPSGSLGSQQVSKQYSPTVITHVSIGDVGNVPIAGALPGGVLVMAPVTSVAITGGITGTENMTADIWAQDNVQDPLDATKTLAYAVPILPSFIFETQVHGGTAPVLFAVAALPAAVKTTVSTSTGPAIAYITSANKPVYAVVLGNKACLIPPIIARFDISGQPMVANPGAIYDLGSIPLLNCP